MTNAAIACVWEKTFCAASLEFVTCSGRQVFRTGIVLPYICGRGWSRWQHLSLCFDKCLNYLGRNRIAFDV